MEFLHNSIYIGIFIYLFLFSFDLQLFVNIQNLCFIYVNI